MSFILGQSQAQILFLKFPSQLMVFHNNCILEHISNQLCKLMIKFALKIVVQGEAAMDWTKIGLK